MRRALIFSLAAHGFVLWLMVNEYVREADTAGSLLAVTIAMKPSITLAAPPAADSPAPKITPNLLLGNDSLAVKNRKDTTPKNVAVAIPVVSTAIAPAILSIAVLDADGLRRYRFALAREIRRAWVYPQSALLQKWEGTTEIRIELLAGGRFASARIEKSSGQQVLDDAALKIISSAAATAPVPSSFFGEAVSIVQPVVFSLRDENLKPEN